MCQNIVLPNFNQTTQPKVNVTHVSDTNNLITCIHGSRPTWPINYNRNEWIFPTSLSSSQCVIYMSLCRSNSPLVQSHSRCRPADAHGTVSFSFLQHPLIDSGTPVDQCWVFQWRRNFPDEPFAFAQPGFPSFSWPLPKINKITSTLLHKIHIVINNNL